MYLKCLTHCLLRWRSRRLVFVCGKGLRNEIAEPLTDLLVTRVTGVLEYFENSQLCEDWRTKLPTAGCAALKPRFRILASLFRQMARRTPLFRQRHPLIAYATVGGGFFVGLVVAFPLLLAQSYARTGARVNCPKKVQVDRRGQSHQQQR